MFDTDDDIDVIKEKINSLADEIGTSVDDELVDELSASILDLLTELAELEVLEEDAY